MLPALGGDITQARVIVGCRETSRTISYWSETIEGKYYRASYKCKVSLTVKSNMEPPVIDGFTPSARMQKEGFRGKFVRKVKENPFVPIGKWGSPHQRHAICSINLYKRSDVL